MPLQNGSSTFPKGNPAFAAGNPFDSDDTAKRGLGGKGGRRKAGGAISLGEKVRARLAKVSTDARYTEACTDESLLQEVREFVQDFDLDTETRRTMVELPHAVVEELVTSENVQVKLHEAFVVEENVSSACVAEIHRVVDRLEKQLRALKPRAAPAPRSTSVRAAINGFQQNSLPTINNQAGLKQLSQPEPKEVFEKAVKVLKWKSPSVGNPKYAYTDVMHAAQDASAKGDVYGLLWLMTQRSERQHNVIRSMFAETQKGGVAGGAPPVVRQPLFGREALARERSPRRDLLSPVRRIKPMPTDKGMGKKGHIDGQIKGKGVSGVVGGLYRRVKGGGNMLQENLKALREIYETLDSAPDREQRCQELQALNCVRKVDVALFCRHFPQVFTCKGEDDINLVVRLRVPSQSTFEAFLRKLEKQTPKSEGGEVLTEADRRGGRAALDSTGATQKRRDRRNKGKGKKGKNAEDNVEGNGEDNNAADDPFACDSIAELDDALLNADPFADKDDNNPFV